MSLKVLPLNVTVVRITQAHALRFGTATMMMPACLSMREVKLLEKVFFFFCNLPKCLDHIHDTDFSCLFSAFSPPLGGDTYRQCIKYSECDYSTLGQKFPKLTSFKYSCCTSDLCNSAPLSVSSRSVVAILLSLALFWWGF